VYSERSSLMARRKPRGRRSGTVPGGMPLPEVPGSTLTPNPKGGKRGDPPPYRDRRSLPSSSFPPVDYQTGSAAQSYVVPTQSSLVTASGRTLKTEMYGDKNYPGRVQLVQPVAIRTQFEAFQYSAGTNQDALAQRVGTYVNNSLYGSIVRGMQKKNILIPTTDTVLTTSSNLPVWLNNWVTAYGTVWSLESMLETGNFNTACGKINDAILANLPGLQGLSRRVREYIVPQELVDWVTCMFGVKIISGTLCPIWYLNNAGQVTSPVDMQVSATVAGFINSAETALNALAPSAGADFARISNLFSKAYRPPVFPKPFISSDIVEYDMLFNMMVCYDDTTNLKFYSAPNPNLPGTGGGAALNIVPVMVRDGTPETSRALEYMTSLLRWPVYSVDPVTGLASASNASSVGLINNELGTPNDETQVGFYDNTALFGNGQSLGAGPNVINEVTYTGRLVEQLYYQAFVAGELVNNSGDQRVPRGYKVFYISPDWMSDESQRIIERMFLSSISA
jgi:hypothetical protein